MGLGLAVVAGYGVLFTWLYAYAIIAGTYLAETDLYEYFLPIFLSPITTWSSYEYGGLPAFADPGDYAFYPPQLVARALGSWTLMAISGHLLAASFTFAYVFFLTRSRTAAAFAGLAYGLSEALVERLPHMGVFHGIAWVPLLMLAIDRLRGERPARWAAGGALALACCFLAGHPQPAIYAAYCAVAYALVGGWAERAPRAYYAWVAAMFALGGLLSAIKAVPFAEASFLMNRQGASFEHFVAFANSAPQMLSLVFPTVIHEGREAPTYVGLATLLFAAVGMTVPRQRWRAVFWLAVVLVTVAIGMGDRLPVARLVYMLPLQDNFRVGARHLFLAALGVAVLAGIGVAAVQSATVRSRRVIVACAGVLLVVGTGVWLILTAPAQFQLENRSELAGLSRQMTGVAVQVALAMATCVAAALFAIARGRFGTALPLMAIVVLDLCYAAPDPLTWTGIARKTIGPDLLKPSVHARALANELAPAHQRFLNVGGTSVDAVVPAAFARLWHMPIAGGYGPMLLGTHARMLRMGSSGGVTLDRLALEDTSLDLLAVKLAAVQPGHADRSPPFDRDGVLWSQQPLELSIGPSDCGHLYPRSMTFGLAEGSEVASVALVARLRCSEEVPQGSAVGSIRVVGVRGDVQEHVLRAGVDIADQSVSDPAVAGRARHQALPPFGAAGEGPAGTLIRFDVRPTRASHIEVHGLPTRGWIMLNRLTVVDGAGRGHPVELPGAFLNNRTRWRVAKRFWTSRLSDRAVDHDAVAEEEYVVYENRHAMRRAWIASEVIPLSDDEIVAAVHHGHLPDGRRFDPLRMALVAGESGMAATRFPERDQTATVREEGDRSVTVDVSAPAGGLLVLSDSMYPGWKATVDGTAVPIVRTDLSLRGVVLPPGAQRVEFVFRSATHAVGALVTAFGAIAAIGLAVVGGRWRNR
jgi:hypothetical protein